MTVTISLRPETEQSLREQAAREGMTLEAYLEKLTIGFASNEGRPPAHRTPEEWIAEWRAWAASHPVFPGLADDDRASIYADRGE